MGLVRDQTVPVTTNIVILNGILIMVGLTSQVILGIVQVGQIISLILVSVALGILIIFNIVNTVVFWKNGKLDGGYIAWS